MRSYPGTRTASLTADQITRAELATFLRAKRDALRPQDFGIATVRRRRAAGLRREEVAQAAGISTTWYVCLEQGRDVKASPHALRSLGKALGLSAAEQSYLLRLARPDLASRQQARAAAVPSASLLALLHGLAPHPAYVVDRTWQVLACNRPAEALLGAFGSDWSGNVIARLFLDPLWRERFVDWAAVARSAVAQFRLATADLARDADFGALLSWLTSNSREFAACWSDRELAEAPIWRKSIRHPGAGTLQFDFATLRPTGQDGDYFMSVYTPADVATRRRLIRLVANSAGP